MNNQTLAVIKTDDAPAAIGPYSQAICVNGLLFASGQLGIVPQTGLLAEGIEGQSSQALENVGALLRAAGTDFDHVVKTTCYLADIADFTTFNEVYARFFPNTKPARSAVGVAALPKGALVEVEVIAALNGDGQ